MVGRSTSSDVVEVVHRGAGERPARRHLDRPGCPVRAWAPARPTAAPGRRGERGSPGLREAASAMRDAGIANRGELTRRLENRHRRRGRRLLDRRAVRQRRALDRDRDAERRAGAARVLELAGEDVQAVGERAGREGERRCPEMTGAGAAAPSSSAPGAMTGSLAVRTIWLADAETDPSAGAEETRRRSRVVEPDVRADGGRRGVVDRVVADRAQVVEAVGEGARVERGAERRARVRCDLRPGAATGGRDAERDPDGAAAGGCGQRHGARDDRAGVGERDARARSSRP